MTASSASSGVAFATALLAVALGVVLLLRHFLPLRTTPAFLLLPVFLALALPASVLILVPIDLASNAVGIPEGHPRGVWLPERALLVCWRICYWLTFALTWAILPILGQYADSGHRETRDRVMYSLKTNSRYQLAVLGSGAVCLVYFFVTSGVEFTSFKGTVMALAYAWGLVLAIYLMGHGLVALPRRLFRGASISGRLRRAQSLAPSIHERLLDSQESLELLEAQVLQLRQRTSGTARQFEDWIKGLRESSDIPERQLAAAQAQASRHPDAAVPTVVTERYMADLTRKLQRARHRRIRFVEEWDACVREARQMQRVLDAGASRRLAHERTTWLPFLGNQPLLTPLLRYHLYATVGPAVRLALSVLSGLGSFAIVWSEVFSRTVPKLSIVSLTVVHHPHSDDGKIGFAGQLIAGAWLLFMVAAALTSIAEVKVWGNRALVKRHTYPESACWYASYVARLTVPLSFNFATLFPDSVFKKTMFFQFLGRLIDLTPLGKGFSAFFPLFIFFPIIATSFNLYSKVTAFAGYGAFEDDDQGSPHGSSSWREGKLLIERELSSDNALGLASRSGAPEGFGTLDAPAASNSILPQYRDDPPHAAAPSSLGPARQESRRAPAPAAEADEGPGGSGFFSDFAHRVRNTLDTATADTPDLFKGLEFQRPKWMAGGGLTGEASGRADAGRGLGRWFGGRPDDGRVRL